MRPFLAFAGLLWLAACTSPAGPPAAAVASGPVVGRPDSLVARLGPTALADAFARLERLDYDARVVVEELDASAAPVGRFERVVRHTAGGRTVGRSTRASGTLADTSGLDPARLRLSDPLPSVLGDHPAYLAPSTRDQYVVEVRPAGGSRRTVVVRHTAATEQALTRVEADVDTATGDVLRAVADRSSVSGIYDEATRAEVRLRSGPSGVVPAAVRTRSTVSTPLAGTRTYRVTWRVAPPRQRANTRKP